MALTATALGAIVDNGFISLDDGDYITRNTLVRDGFSLRGITSAFANSMNLANWHPLTWLSHMLDVELFGLRPGPHHAVNLVLHAANALLLFSLLRSLTGALWKSALVAALFAVHPLHVESVAWVAERKDVLSTFFALWTALAYVRAARRNAVFRSVAIPLLLSMALLSKAMVVTLPFLFLLLDWWPLARWSPIPLRRTAGLVPPLRLWREKTPLFALSATLAIVTYFAQDSGGSVSTALPLRYRIANALVSYARYLGMTLWPQGLSPFYPYPERGLPFAAVAGATLLLAFLTFLSVRFAAGRPFFTAGWLWYLGTLTPVIGLFVQAGGQAMADRYTYFPLTGIFVAVVWSLAGIVQRRGSLLVPAGAFCLAVLVALAATARMQAVLWKDDKTLFSHALRLDPANWVAWNVLGLALLKEGRAEEAAEHFAKASALHQSYFDGTHNLGAALIALDRAEEAAAAFKEALRIKPRDPLGNLNLGRTLVQLGQPEQALGFLQDAVALNPYDTAARAALGAALAATGRQREAERSLEQALRLNSGNLDAHYNLGALLLSEGRVIEALPHSAALLRAEGTSGQVHVAIGTALADRARNQEAMAHFRKAVEIEPDNAAAHQSLGEALFESGAVGEAIGHLERAVEIDPSVATAHNNLGAALATAGRLDEATSAFRKALALDGGSFDTHFNLGLALTDRGELEAAAFELLAASALDPADARVRPALNAILEQPRGKESYARALRRRSLLPGPREEPARLPSVP